MNPITQPENNKESDLKMKESKAFGYGNIGEKAGKFLLHKFRNETRFANSKFCNLDGATAGTVSGHTFPDMKPHVWKEKGRLSLHGGTTYSRIKKINGKYVFPEFRKVDEELQNQFDEIDSQIRELKDKKNKIASEKFMTLQFVELSDIDIRYMNDAQRKVYDQVLDDLGIEVDA